MYAWFKQCDLKRKVIIPLLVLIEKQIRLFLTNYSMMKLKQKLEKKTGVGNIYLIFYEMEDLLLLFCPHERLLTHSFRSFVEDQ